MATETDDEVAWELLKFKFQIISEFDLGLQLLQLDITNDDWQVI